MKKIFVLITILLFSCCEKKKTRVCQYSGMIVIEKHDFRKTFSSVYYTMQDEKRDVYYLEAYQIDYDSYNVGDIIKPCK